ncbi:MAG: hypothetical protein ABFE07_24350 [Armatimonadia bacterium]
MRSVRITVIAVVAASLLLQVAAMAAQVPTKDYPIRVDTRDYGTYKKDVVIVLTAVGERELDDFMSQTVPTTLRETGALPEPAAGDTQLYKPVQIPAAKRVYIMNKDALPVWLRVKANNNPQTSARQDCNERFKGSVNDPYTFQNYFITQYTAIAPVVKHHRTVTKTIRLTHKMYNWIDP